MTKICKTKELKTGHGVGKGLWSGKLSGIFRVPALLIILIGTGGKTNHAISKPHARTGLGSLLCLSMFELGE